MCCSCINYKLYKKLWTLNDVKHNRAKEEKLYLASAFELWITQCPVGAPELNSPPKLKMKIFGLKPSYS